MAFATWLCVLTALSFHMMVLAEDMADEPGLVELLSPDLGSPLEEITEEPGLQWVEPDEIQEIISEFQVTAAVAERTYRVLPTEETARLYEQMTRHLDAMIKLLDKKENVYKFLKARGFEKVIGPHLEIKNPQFVNKLLVLLKSLFRKVPMTIRSIVPITTVDKILDILEKDDLAGKAHALDILYFWLPGNPKVQARVLLVKELDLFYHQIDKLDIYVVHKLLDLFNKILVEHLNALRSEKGQRNEDDLQKLKIYQRIGLLEMMSTPKVCTALLNIFEAIQTYSAKNGKIASPAFELLKNTKVFCFDMYVGKPRAMQVLTGLQAYVNDPRRQDEFANVTGIRELLNVYTRGVKSINFTKEEL